MPVLSLFFFFSFFLFLFLPDSVFNVSDGGCVQTHTYITFDVCDFNHDMVVGNRWAGLSISKTADLLGN